MWSIRRRLACSSEANGSVRVESDRHIEGLFARSEWIQLLTEAGFDARAVPIEHSEIDRPYEVFVCTRPRL